MNLGFLAIVPTKLLKCDIILLVGPAACPLLNVASFIYSNFLHEYPYMFFVLEHLLPSIFLD